MFSWYGGSALRRRLKTTKALPTSRYKCKGRFELGSTLDHSSITENFMSKTGTIKQIFDLILERKAWWLVPMVVVFLLVGLLIVATQGSALSPFIYALF